MTDKQHSKFGMVSSTVVQDPELSLAEKGLYAYLSSYANSKTKDLTVGLNRMSSENGMSVSSVKRHLKSLEVKGVIRRLSRGSASKITVLLK